MTWASSGTSPLLLNLGRIARIARIGRLRHARWILWAASPFLLGDGLRDIKSINGWEARLIGALATRDPLLDENPKPEAPDELDIFYYVITLCCFPWDGEWGVKPT